MSFPVYILERRTWVGPDDEHESEDVAAYTTEAAAKERLVQVEQHLKRYPAPQDSHRVRELLVEGPCPQCGTEHEPQKVAP